jgi:hypothetical protein
MAGACITLANLSSLPLDFPAGSGVELLPGICCDGYGIALSVTAAVRIVLGLRHGARQLGRLLHEIFDEPTRGNGKHTIPSKS